MAQFSDKHTTPHEDKIKLLKELESKSEEVKRLSALLQDGKTNFKPYKNICLLIPPAVQEETTSENTQMSPKHKEKRQLKPRRPAPPPPPRIIGGACKKSSNKGVAAVAEQKQVHAYEAIPDLLVDPPPECEDVPPPLPLKRRQSGHGRQHFLRINRPGSSFSLPGFYERSHKTVVIDCGSGVCKAGLADKVSPNTVFDSVVGTSGAGKKSKTFVGSKVYHQQGTGPPLLVSSPVRRGIVVDWDSMEKILQHIFCHELQVKPEDHPVLLSETPLNPRPLREKMAELVFESLCSPALFMANSGVLSLYSTRYLTGMAVGCGDGMSYTVPVYEGHSIPTATNLLDLGGQDLTQYLTQMLAERGCVKIDRNAAADIKRMCYVALDFNSERKLTSGDSLEKSYILPDGRTIFVKDERYKCPEALFQPHLLNKQCPGLHQCCQNSIMKCREDLRRDISSNILVSGGSTMFPFMPDRLQKEMSSLAQPGVRAMVTAASSRKFAVWIGGSVLASHSSFENSWVSKACYEEFGASIVSRMCFT